MAPIPIKPVLGGALFIVYINLPSSSPTLLLFISPPSPHFIHHFYFAITSPSSVFFLPSFFPSFLPPFLPSSVPAPYPSFILASFFPLSSLPFDSLFLGNFPPLPPSLPLSPPLPLCFLFSMSLFPLFSSDIALPLSFLTLLYLPYSLPL